jgi:Na+-transporting methylmalonyl-CoA/oxaloacetate decarboxylase gamma subunit
MEQAVSIFINGLGGVFAGMAILYLTMKLISLTAGWQSPKGK